MIFWKQFTEITYKVTKLFNIKWVSAVKCFWTSESEFSLMITLFWKYFNTYLLRNCKLFKKYLHISKNVIIPFYNYFFSLLCFIHQWDIYPWTEFENSPHPELVCSLESVGRWYGLTQFTQSLWVELSCAWTVRQ